MYMRLLALLLVFQTLVFQVSNVYCADDYNWWLDSKLNNLDVNIDEVKHVINSLKEDVNGIKVDLLSVVESFARNGCDVELSYDIVGKINKISIDLKGLFVIIHIKYNWVGKLKGFSISVEH